MAKTIGEYLTTNGYEIGRDVIRVKPSTRFRNIGTKEEHDMSPLNFEEDGFYYDGQGVGVISRPLTNEYYVTDNKDLVRELAKHFDIERKEGIGLSGFAYGVEFVDKKMQKAWTDHLEYMKPENVEARRYAKVRFDERARLREQNEKDAKRVGLMPMAVKDVIRQGGFTPQDYVELKEGMVDLGPASAAPDYKSKLRKEIKLPKEEDVAAKRYIIYDGGTYMIGNTDTNEAILTQNRELVAEFKHRGFTNIDDKYDVPYRHHHYGTTFEDPKIQKRWETHKGEVKKQEALINKETQHYIIQHQDDLKERVGFEKRNNYAFPEQTSDMHVINDMARAEVLKQRAEARRATRNITTEYQIPFDYFMKKEDSFSQERVEERKKELKDRKESRLAKAFKEKHSETPLYLAERFKEVSSQPEVKQETPAKSPNVWKRLAQKFGGRR